MNRRRFLAGASATFSGAVLKQAVFASTTFSSTVPEASPGTLTFQPAKVSIFAFGAGCRTVMDWTCEGLWWNRSPFIGFFPEGSQYQEKLASFLDSPDVRAREAWLPERVYGSHALVLLGDVSSKTFPYIPVL